MAQNSLPNQYIPKRVSIFTAPGDSDMNTIENYDGSITKMRSREICNENGSKRTEIKSETFGGIIKVDTDVKVTDNDTKYQSEEVSIVKKGGKEITTRVRIYKEDDGNITRTTIREIKNRDGTILYETNVETNNSNNKQDLTSQPKRAEINLPTQTEPNIKVESVSIEKNMNVEPIKDEETHEEQKSEEQLIVPSSIHRGSVCCLVKKKYEKDYKLTENQYNLIRDYFDRFQKDELISKSLFKNHLNQVLGEKKSVTATEQQIVNALDIIDSDSNDLDFDEFIDFMTLFFASKNNLKTRINNVLHGHQFTHTNTGSLTPEEAEKYQTFLIDFYQSKKGVDDKFIKDLLYDEFSITMKPKLVDNLFVNK